MSAEVFVLGSGLEGLCAALTLARGRRKVTVLEPGPRIGGADAREEFHPGFHANGLDSDLSLVRRELLGPLGLEAHGLRWRDQEPALLVPHASGCPLLFRREATRMDGELPPDERARLLRFDEVCSAARSILAGLLDATPPDATGPSTAELLGLANKALQLRRLGRSPMLTLARILPSPAQDWMDEALGMEALRVALTGPALVGTVLGPRAPGTSAFVLLRQALGRPGPRGGAAMLAAALAEACVANGVELRTATPVRALRLGPSGVQALELASGETLPCRAVLSTLGTKKTLLELVPAGSLAPSLERAAGSFRTRGGTAVLRLALSQPPRFLGREQDAIEHALSAPDLRTLERASDALKYGELPRDPWIEVRVPSVADASLAPAGQAVVLLTCHTAPRNLAAAGGWNEGPRSRLTRAMLAALEGLAPGAGATLVASQLLTPEDIETRYGKPGGHLYDGELALDQLWVQRPALALARYATPIAGLFLGGQSSHPGGPFRCGAGVLAARALLASA